MKKPREYSAWFEGIADFNKTGGPAAYQSGHSIDHRTDTRSIRLQPRTIKESGSVVTDLVKWIVTPPSSCNKTYLYGENGNFYERTSAGAYSLLRTVSQSHGNGLGWFGEDNFVYYTRDALIGRYGPICSSNPTFKDDFFGSQGGNPTNTNSLELLSASSQYGSRASTSSLQVAGDLSISAQIYPYTLPVAGNSFTIASKWTEASNLRSYKFDISPVSNYFGNGTDGALTIASDTTEAPIDSACTGTVGGSALTATNILFTAGQIILIHQTRGTGAGTWERNTIQSYTAGTITTLTPLTATYVSGAQVRVLPQYSAVTINSGKTYSPKAWNGTVGGILAFIASGTVTVNGTITANGGNSAGHAGGFRGYAAGGGLQGEGSAGAGNVVSRSANGSGGGGSSTNSSSGGGGNGTAGGDGQGVANGFGGVSTGTTDLTTMLFGGAGGTVGSHVGGEDGGGIIYLVGTTITVASTGAVTANGKAGVATSSDASGGGAGGSILLEAQTATLDTTKVTATGGAGGNPGGGKPRGGNGGVGRIHLDYLTSYTGTTTPALDATQDPTLGSSAGQTLRLQLSSTGTNIETYYKNASITENIFQQVGVVWTASTSTAEFFLNGVSLGTQVGVLTSINANAAVFSIGRYLDGTSTTSGLYNGLIDEVQAYDVVRTISDFQLSMQSEVLTTTTGLVAYYQFNSVATDSTANANNLTLTGSPAYSPLVPFSGSSTRLNLDQSNAASGFDYDVPTAISEASTEKMVFAPTKDPQLSIAVTILAKGTGDWTLTVHDQFNNLVASITVANANLAAGLYEFIFTTPWRILIGSNYHFHLTSTVNDGTVQTGTDDDLSTVNYQSYFAFLISDTQFHPVAPFLQFMVFGNERYVGKLEATLYDPNKITLPAGWKVRCFAYWNEYLAIGAWRGDIIDQFDQGRIFFWDGASITYNFYIDVPEGAINAMIGTRGSLYFIAGSRAKLLVYQGGAQARKIKNLINSENGATIDIYPAAMTMWRTLMRFGVAGNNQETNLPQGVYTWGSVNEKYPDSLSFDYPISTGTYLGTSVRIGAVYPVNGDLLIGWNDGTANGVDKVSFDNDVYPEGSIEFLIEDEDAMYHEKELVTIATEFEPLVSGQSVQLKYRLDRNATWTTFDPVTNVGSTTDRQVISLNGSRYREYEIGVNLATSLSTGPIVLAVSAEPELLEKEHRVG